MSIKTLARVWEHSTRQGAALLLELALADFADDAGWCWPSVPTLARKARVSVRAAQMILREIEAAGDVMVQPMAGAVRTPGGVQRTNRYRLVVGLQGGAEVSPPLPQRGAQDGEGGANSAQGGAVAVAPNPSLEPSLKPSLGNGGADVAPPQEVLAANRHKLSELQRLIEEGVTPDDALAHLDLPGSDRATPPVASAGEGTPR